MKKTIRGATGVLEVETKEAGAIKVIKLKGQMDISTSDEINKIINGYLEQGGTPKMVIDMSGVAHIDSYGLSVLIFANSSLGKKGGLLKLAGLKGKPRDVFDLANLTRLFNICDSEEAALENF